MYLLIDNYDSFTYNIVNLVKSLGENILVVKNDEMTGQEILKRDFKGIILSPGPSRPETAGHLLEIIRSCYKTIPILGICLGHQAIGMVFGGEVVKAKQIMHGKMDGVTHEDDLIFNKVATPFEAVRYHSLVVKNEHLPQCLKRIAFSVSDHEIMAIKHRDYPVYGLQFHPESFKTDVGAQIIKNFFKIVEGGLNDEQQCIRSHTA